MKAYRAPEVALVLVLMVALEVPGVVALEVAMEVAAVVAMLVLLYVEVSAQSPGLRPEEATRGALGDRPCRGGR